LIQNRHRLSYRVRERIQLLVRVIHIVVNELYFLLVTLTIFNYSGIIELVL